jgi:hypothetical protein
MINADQILFVEHGTSGSLVESSLALIFSWPMVELEVVSYSIYYSLQTKAQSILSISIGNLQSFALKNQQFIQKENLTSHSAAVESALRLYHDTSKRNALARDVHTPTRFDESRKNWYIKSIGSI